LTPCVFEITEHFVLENDDASARMYLGSSEIFQTLVNHLEFLSQLQPNVTIQANGKWIARETFSNIFRYTQLQNEDTMDLNLCTSFLFIHNDNASVCKLGKEIRFSNEACSTLVNKLVKFNSWPDNSFEQTL
jgi:hypothetical protein